MEPELSDGDDDRSRVQPGPMSAFWSAIFFAVATSAGASKTVSELPPEAAKAPTAATSAHAAARSAMRGREVIAGACPGAPAEACPVRGTHLREERLQPLVEQYRADDGETGEEQLQLERPDLAPQEER